MYLNDPVRPTFIVPQDIPEECRKKCAVIAAQGIGLTIRQYYKAAALQGLSSQDSVEFRRFGYENKQIEWAKLTAKRCGDIADAMLLEDAQWEKEKK